MKLKVRIYHYIEWHMNLVYDSNHQEILLQNDIYNIVLFYINLNFMHLKQL